MYWSYEDTGAGWETRSQTSGECCPELKDVESRLTVKRVECFGVLLEIPCASGGERVVNTKHGGILFQSEAPERSFGTQNLLVFVKLEMCRLTIREATGHDNHVFVSSR